MSTKPTSLLILALLQGVVALCIPPHVEACLCSGAVPLLESYQRAEAVFVGTVTEVSDVIEGRSFAGYRNQFKIEEGFKGVSSETLEIFSETTSCTIFFRPGERYLVYALRMPHRDGLSAYKCTPTAPVAEASAVIAYTRRLSKGDVPTMLTGRVNEFHWEAFAEERSYRPLAGVRVVAENATNTYETTTDERGSFVVFDIPAGHYRVRPVIEGNVRGTEAREVTVPPNGTAGVWFATTSLGSIRGRIVDPTGRNVRTPEIWAVLPDGRTRERVNPSVTRPEADGTFTLWALPPGEYMLVANGARAKRLSDARYPTSYFVDRRPGAKEVTASVITVRRGETVTLGDWVLPTPYPTGKLRGRVVTADGLPVARALVRLEAVTGTPEVASEWTREDGTFEIVGFVDTTYSVDAEVLAERGARSSEPVTLRIVPEQKPIRLVVHPRPWGVQVSGRP